VATLRAEQDWPMLEITLLRFARATDAGHVVTRMPTATIGTAIARWRKSVGFEGHIAWAEGDDRRWEIVGQECERPTIDLTRRG